jgi:hypothetical protein
MMIFGSVSFGCSCVYSETLVCAILWVGSGVDVVLLVDSIFGIVVFGWRE